ncbi:MAG: hypothetical protein AAF481_19900 [Acidobacteriota bacterium]
MTTLPDFSELFRGLAGRRPRKIRYRIRFDSNYRHDESFLSSLVHDARLVPERVSLRGRRLLLPLERDCWEYGLTPIGDNELELHNSVAVLRMFPVANLDWSFADRPPKPDTELCIRNLFEIRKMSIAGSESPYTLLIRGYEWQVSVVFEEHKDDPLVEVQDKTVPTLWSEIEKNSKLRRRFGAS